MASQPTGIGDRVRSVRKRRGLTQRELADASGLSVHTIQKLEQGEGENSRVETVRRIAVALAVPTTALIASVPPKEDRTAGNWDEVREAVTAPPPVAADESPADLAPVIAEAVSLYQDHRYDGLALLLPSLLASAHGADPLLKSRAFDLAGSALIQTRHRETATMALDIAMAAADDSQTDAVAAVNTRCWLLILERKYGEVIDLAGQWADRIEPRMSTAKPIELSSWAWLLLRISAAAIRDNQPDVADDTMRLATAAAMALRPSQDHAPHPWWSLGNLSPAVVTMKAAENAFIAGRPDATLQLAARVPPRLKSMDNLNRHLLDVSAAHLELHQPDEAFDVLRRLRAEAAQWLAQQDQARDILARIIDRRRKLTTEMRELAAAISLPL